MTKPLNIAILTETYLPQVNGVVTSTLTFQEELEKLGHNVWIMCPKVSEDEASTDKVWRFRSIPFPFQKEHRIVSPMSRKLKQFKELNIDVIHIQTPFMMGHLGQYLSWRYKIPVVHTYHTYWMEYLHYFPLLPERLRKQADLLLLTKKFCNRCDHIVVPSRQMREKLVEDGVTAPMTVIPTGIKINIRRSAEEVSAFRSRYGLPPEAPVLIFVGRLGMEKNVYFLLESFKTLLLAVPNAYLFIAGNGPQFDAMREYATQHGFIDQVRMPGYLSHDDVFTAYAAANVIAFPSKTETQGLSLLEGLSLGKPAVCLNAMGVKDILDHERGGFLTEESVSAFTEKLVLLLKDPAVYQKKSREAAERAEEFSSTAMAKRLVDVYRYVIDHYSGDTVCEND